MGRGEAYREIFACPGCKELLELRLNGYEFLASALGSLIVAFLITYIRGKRGAELWVVGLFISLLIFYGSVFVLGLFFPPKLMRVPGPEKGCLNDYGRILRPPGSSDPAA
jgi:hypothetical protein